MNSAGKSILTINGGSSSIKFALFAANRSLRIKLTGRVERIGLPETVFSVQGADRGENFTLPVVAKDHMAAVATLMDWIEEREKDGGLIAVGHRTVHGGSNYHKPQRLTSELVEELRRLTLLDPEHLPARMHMLTSPLQRVRRIPRERAARRRRERPATRLALLQPPVPVDRRHRQDPRTMAGPRSWSIAINDSPLSA